MELANVKTYGKPETTSTSMPSPPSNKLNLDVISVTKKTIITGDISASERMTYRVMLCNSMQYDHLYKPYIFLISCFNLVLKTESNKNLKFELFS